MRADAPGDERRLAIGAALTLAALTPPVLAVAGIVAGLPGIVGAAIGLALVGLLFVAAAGLLAVVAARWPTGGLGVLVAGAAFRIGIYVVVLDLLSGVAWVHASSLAIATAIAIAVTLAAELRLLARLPRLFFIDADAARSPATATRSEPL